ncbi:hypothetical protein [Thiohalomonas denitrificans]|uniref:hypothetical protein n=1 Tax=Thiohalomonas denitrificans TaxID=415747 RepID=UPI0026EAE369|nr:hypothetical protein [Thiohalomonas denitrificans]
MKKLITAGLLSLAMMTSFSAMAAGTNFSTGTVIQNDNTGCELLGEPVTLQLSKNVHGAYSCAVIDASIKVATCHEAGSRKATALQCQSVGTDPLTNETIWNDSSCTAAADTFDIADFRSYAASSTGGTVAPGALGGACEDSTIAAIDHFN